MPSLLNKRRAREETEEQPETAQFLPKAKIVARVALILLACHTSYVFRSSVTSSNLRGLLESSKDTVTKIVSAAGDDEPPAWTRALEPFSSISKESNNSSDRGISRGILSNKPLSFFRELQDKVDRVDVEKRCQRFGYSPLKKNYFHKNHTSQTTTFQRRIFFGSLIASESWETLDIVATEAYGVLEGVVFVESNRTQMFKHRPVNWDDAANNTDRLKALFGTQNVQVRQFVNEDNKLLGLEREQVQRSEIEKGWKELGMGPNDVGYVGDVDETFSREFLRVVQSCDIPAFDHEKHHCNSQEAKILGFTRVFETSPECIGSIHKSWYHPDMVVGACVEEIGNLETNPHAPRIGTSRAPGFGACRRGVENITDDQHPLYTAGDIRTACGGKYQFLNAPNYTTFSGFHMHNFFVDFEALRFKYLTYGHPVPRAMTMPLEKLNADVEFMIRCVKNQTDAPEEDQREKKDQNPLREPGGVDAALPPLPIYFMDKDYRDRKHNAIKVQIEQDEKRRRERLKMGPIEQEVEDASEELEEAKRLVWAKEAHLEKLKKKLSEAKKGSTRR
ncbi:expressed unknown protein [Seminavis robusta]|uniref:Uncharacterized protein n=1 Tax=Seminavis robusta TaxID=568900 RepID=A0A9N8DFK6_9STRA|nr:expressed unknown protein [Seminavis robusta]|eukprot:Sro101_g051610.1 n/a (562) ;mRNA; f:56169-57854